jgi:phage gp46-like protein
MRLIYDDSTGFFDLALAKSGGLDSGVGNGGLIESAIWSSLFTDGCADPSELTPDLGDDRRGWWGDSGRSQPESLARSLLWLYRRAKQDENTRLAILRNADASLQWLREEGVVSDIAVEVSFLPSPLEGVQITVTTFEPNGVRRDWKVDQVWGGLAS